MTPKCQTPTHAPGRRSPIHEFAAAAMTMLSGAKSIRGTVHTPRGARPDGLATNWHQFIDPWDD